MRAFTLWQFDALIEGGVRLKGLDFMQGLRNALVTGCWRKGWEPMNNLIMLPLLMECSESSPSSSKVS